MTNTNNPPLHLFTVQVEGVGTLSFDPSEQVILPMPPPGWMWQELPLDHNGVRRKQYRLIRDTTVEKFQTPPWWFPAVKRDIHNRKLLVIDPRLWVECSRVVKAYRLEHAEDKEAEQKRNEQAIAAMRAAYEKRKKVFAQEVEKRKRLQEEYKAFHREQEMMWAQPIVHPEDEEAT